VTHRGLATDAWAGTEAGFEAASIKLDPKADGADSENTPGPLRAQMTLMYIAYAYDVKDFQVRGGPNWIDLQWVRRLQLFHIIYGKSAPALLEVSPWNVQELNGRLELGTVVDEAAVSIPALVSGNGSDLCAHYFRRKRGLNIKIKLEEVS
jgi:hypothetical protein